MPILFPRLLLSKASEKASLLPFPKDTLRKGNKQGLKDKKEVLQPPLFRFPKKLSSSFPKKHTGDFARKTKGVEIDNAPHKYKNSFPKGFAEHIQSTFRLLLFALPLSGNRASFQVLSHMGSPSS